MLHKGWSAAQRKDPDMLIKANYFSLTPRRFIAGTKNSYGVETISFEFSSEWDGLNKTVTFYPVGGAPVAVLYVDSPVYIPAEVMACPGTAQFTVSGTKGSRSLISVTGYIDVLDTNDPGSKPAVEPTPSEMAQVLDMMRAALDAANRVNTGANLDLAVLNSSFLHFSGDVYFESDTVSKKFFAKFFSLCIRGSVAQDIATDKTIEEIASACGLSLVTSTKGVTGCLCIPDEYVISYCTDDNSIKYGHRSDPILKDSSNIVIIAQNGGRLVDGLPFIQNMMIEALENKIGDGGTAEDSGTDDIIPSYWESAVNTAVSKLEAYQNEGGIDSFTFGFITDTHRKYYLDGTFASLMRRVLDSCDIPVFFHGGDLVDGAANVPKDELIADIKHHKEVFKSIEGKMLQAFGNHDSVYGINDLYDGGLNDAEIYNYIYRDNEGKNGIVRGATGRYFYKDNPVQKVRYIVLDSQAFETVIDTNGIATTGNKLNKAQYGAVQLSWLTDALNVESGYSIVICSHMAPYRASDLTAIGWTGENCCADSDVALGIVNAYRNGTSYNYSGTVDGEAYSISVNYSARVGDIVCWVAGHSHKDHIFELDGLKVVCSANCSLHQSTNPTGFAPAKTVGTDTEFAMDFFCVNKNSRTCNIVRLGATLEDDGVRNFAYSNETPSTTTFKIEGNDAGNESYTAEEGMTWAEWVESINYTEYVLADDNYNPTDDGEYIMEDYTSKYIYSEEDEDGHPIYVKSSDTIIANHSYMLTESRPTALGSVVTFTINGLDDTPTKIYEVEEGMTWLEWVNSEYNTDGYTCDENEYIISPDSYYVQNHEQTEVIGSDVINTSIEYNLY